MINPVFSKPPADYFCSSLKSLDASQNQVEQLCFLTGIKEVCEWMKANVNHDCALITSPAAQNLLADIETWQPDNFFKLGFKDGNTAAVQQTEKEKILEELDNVLTPIIQHISSKGKQKASDRASTLNMFLNSDHPRIGGNNFLSLIGFHDTVKHYREFKIADKTCQSMLDAPAPAPKSTSEQFRQTMYGLIR